MSQKQAHMEKAPYIAPRTEEKPTASAPADEEQGASKKKPTSFGRFLRDVGIVVILAIGAIYAYKRHVTVKAEVQELLVDAESKLLKDDIVSLKAAEAKYLEALELDGNNDWALAELAETYFRQYFHGLDTLGRAKEYLAKAESSNSKRAARYATKAYIDIAEGRAREANRYIKELLDQKIASPKLAHAYGWSLLENGQYNEADRALKQAANADFRAAAFALTVAESAHRQGNERAAARVLRDILRDRMSPEHNLARIWLAALDARNYADLRSVVEAIGQVTTAQSASKTGPKTAAYLAWAEGEFAYAIGNDKAALEKADAALATRPNFPPFLGLKARAYRAQKQSPKAIETYELALKEPTKYNGLTWELARLLSKKKDDRALALVQELENATPENVRGPEFEIFRGEHYLRKGDLKLAKDSFHKAAELGDDPAILFGLAKLSFAKQKAKNKGADLEEVVEAISQTLEKRPIYPEVYEQVARIDIWNYSLDSANNNFQTAEAQYKKLKRPLPEMTAFYARVKRAFTQVPKPNMRAQGQNLAKAWEERQKTYVASVVSF